MSVVGLLALVIVSQVPPLYVSARPPDSLHVEQEAILSDEAENLKALAERLAATGDRDAAAEVRRDLPPPLDRSGAERFLPLPEVVAARGSRPGLPNVPVGAKTGSGWKAERAAIRQYEGGYSRAEAELLAWRELENRWNLAHGERVLRELCAGCRRPIGTEAALDLIDGNRVHDPEDNDCLIRHGERWRATAARALIAMGLQPPAGA